MPVPISPYQYNTRSPIENDAHMVAGYEECLREALRFLIYEEQLPLDHPFVVGLTLHLEKERAHQELIKISEQLANKLNEDSRLQEYYNTQKSTVETSCFDESVKMADSVAGYQLILEENGDSDEEYTDDEMDLVYSDDFEKEDKITGDDILSDPTLRKELIRMTFQGCDLQVTAPC